MIWFCGLAVAALPGIILAQWTQSWGEEQSLFSSLPLTCWMALGKSFNSHCFPSYAESTTTHSFSKGFEMR